MTAYNFLVVMAGVLFNAIAQIMLKFGANAMNSSKANSVLEKIIAAVNVPIFFGLLCYMISVVIWIYALSKLDVSVAYPMLSIGYVIVTLLAHYFLGEDISSIKIVAIGVIIFGVMLISKA